MLKNYWLNFLARAVYGILLPGFLLHLSLTSHFGLVRERQILAWQQKMHDSLDNLSNYHDDDRFFHGLLQTNFNSVDQAVEPRREIEKKISLLKNRFPGMLQFVVLDSDGKIMPQLSDEKRFQYVFKALHQILRQSDEMVVASKIGLLRGYFGQFFMEKHLKWPMGNDYLGSCIRASEEPQKALLWFQLYRNFTLVCFIKKDLLDKQLGPRLLIDSFNRRSRDLKLGYFDPRSQILYGLGDEIACEPEIKIEAGAYANSAIESRQTDSHLLLFRQVSPRLVIFSRLAKREHLLDIGHEVSMVMFWLLKWLIVAAFIGFALSLHSSRLFLSVRQKLLLLFLFANGLPLMILAATGYEFFEQKKSSLINAAHERSSRLIKDFDSRYPAGRELMAEKLNQFIALKNRAMGSEVWPAETIAELSQIIQYFRPSENYLFNLSGEQMLKRKTDAMANSDKFIRDFFRGGLEFFNNRSEIYVASKKTMLEQISDEASVYQSVLRQVSMIEQQNYGSGLHWTYLNLLGDRDRNSSWGMLVIIWRPQELQQAYLKDELEALNNRIAPRRLLVMETGTEKIFPQSFAAEKNLRRIMHRTQSRKLLTEDSLLIGGKEYIATSLKGIELADAVIMAIYPRDIILDQIETLFWRVIFAAAASLFLVVIIVVFFSRRLLVPISALADGIRAIARRDFKHRIDFASEDEFGQLIGVFNDTIAGMQDLAVGTAVQKSLLPPGKSHLKRVSLYARSEFMSRMGGDYFDYFKIGDDRLGIFFGDVAGHGIPAALVMSMAKAVVANARASFIGPSALLQRANSIFLHLKARGWRRMMTAQCLELNCDTGQFTLANAGQCFPVIVGTDRQGVTYVKAVGMPLGNVTKKPYAEITGQLVPGDTLILYTDGIIESTNQAGEVFDFARFDKLLLASWNSDLETWWQDIFNGYSGWAAAQDDDITMLMLKYEK